jgi:hypothetical protein
MRMKKFKALVLALILLFVPITNALPVEISKFFDISNRKIEITIDVGKETKNVIVIDFLPFCFDAEEISHDGIVRKTKEGISFIEWNIQAIGRITLSYLPKKIIECPKELTLSPARIIIDGNTFFSNQIKLTENDLNQIKNEICIVNGKCEYPSENYFNCPKDCVSGSQDGVCDGIKDDRCDPDCVRFKMLEQDPDCLKLREKERRPLYLYLIIIATIFLLVIFLIYKIKVIR